MKKIKKINLTKTGNYISKDKRKDKKQILSDKEKDKSNG